MQTNLCFAGRRPPCVISDFAICVALLLSLSASGRGGSGDVHHKGRGGAGGRRTGWKDGVCHSQSRISLWRDQVKRFLQVLLNDKLFFKHYYIFPTVEQDFLTSLNT